MKSSKLIISTLIKLGGNMKKNVILFLVLFFSFLVQLSYSQPVMNEIYSLGVAGNLDWI